MALSLVSQELDPVAARQTTRHLLLRATDLLEQAIEVDVDNVATVGI